MSRMSEIHMPPQNLDAEMSFVGSLMLGPNYLDEVSLDPDDIYSMPAQTIYMTLQKMWSTGNRGIDAVTVAQELVKTGKFEAVGGAQYLERILETVPHAAHVNYYAGIVRECARRRRIINACTDAMKYAYEGGAATSAEIIEQLDQRIQQLIDGTNGKAFASMAEAVDELEHMERNPCHGISTGLRSVDNYLKHGGFTPGQLVVAAGRPGGGKSVLLGQIAKCAAEKNAHALIVSLEMAKYELAERYTETIDRTILRGLPIHFTETAFTIDRIRQAIRASVRRYGTNLAVVDYLQLVGVQDTRKTRDQQIGEVTRGLKLLAKEVKIPIVVGCQLNRGSEKEDRPPRLTDLRESGSIEQDADVVILLHHSDDGAESKIIIGKQRGGMTGNIPVVFDRRRSQFRELDPEKGFFGS